MPHGDARVGKYRGNWRMEWVASTLHTTSEHGVSCITTADVHTTAARVDAPADLNGLVRFAERRNLVSARVPSHFKCSLLIAKVAGGFRGWSGWVRKISPPPEFQSRYLQPPNLRHFCKLYGRNFRTE
jgi:hypothetical protein